MPHTKNEKYLSLIFIVTMSIIFTLITIFIFMEPIKQFLIPSYANCYQLLQNIDTIDNKIFSISLFYISFFILYFIFFSFVLVKILKQIEMQNIYSTLIILIIFNALLMGTVMYITFQARNSSVGWCTITKEGCESSYKILNNMDHNTSFIPTLEEIKLCLFNFNTYLEKSAQALKKRKQ